MSPSSIGKRIGAVDHKTNRAVIKQARDFRQLRAVRANLRRRDRDASLLGLFSAGEGQRKDREQGTTALQCL